MTTPVEAHATSAAVNSIGLAYFSIATGRLLLAVVGGGSLIPIVQASAYTACSLFFWIAQMVYHIVLRTGRQNITLRNVDRGSVLFLLAGTFTPLVAPSGADQGATLLPLAVLWGCAIGGMVLLVVWKAVPRMVAPLFSLVMALVGISATFVTTIFGGMVAMEGTAVLIIGSTLFLAGGAAYATKEPNPFPGKFGFHELYHALVLGGMIVLHVLVAIVMIR